MAERRERAADKRSNDEHPNVGKRVAADKQSGSEAARGVDRSAGEINAENVDEREREAYYYARDRAVFFFGCDAKNGKHEDKGQDDFNKQRKPDVVFVKSVLAECLIAAQKAPKHGCARDSARELRNDVADEITERKSAVYKHGKTNRGVDMAAGNVPYGIRHSNDDETERKSGKHISGIVADRATCHHSRAASEQHEHERADEFGKILFECLHNDLLYKIIRRSVTVVCILPLFVPRVNLFLAASTGDIASRGVRFVSLQSKKMYYNIIDRQDRRAAPKDRNPIRRYRRVETGKRICALREARGMTQEQLAELLYVSRHLISKWETGLRRPDYGTVTRMAEIFRVDPDAILPKSELALDELAECVPDGCDMTGERLNQLMRGFLDGLPQHESDVFLQRYYFLRPPSEIAAIYGKKGNHVRSMLSKTRKKLKRYLKEAEP